LLLDSIDEAYRQFDEDRLMLERTLELSSEELLQANSQMRAILGAFPDLFVRLRADGTIVSVHATSDADLLTRIDRLVGRKIQDVPDRRVGELLRDGVARARRTRAAVTVEYALEIRGRPNTYEARIVPLLEDELMVIVRNITSHRLLEERLRQSEKMEALGRLAGGVAHDFNNILTTILGYGNIALAQVPPDSLLHEQLEEVTRAGTRASELTRQLLAFTRKQVVEPKIVDLSGIVRDMGGMMRRLIGEDVDLQMRLADRCWVCADASQIGQVVLNLVVNARDAMAGGGTLTLETARVEVVDRRAAGVGDVPCGSYASLSVRDTGLGMDEETQSHLFEPFFTTKEKGKGTGLGLATVYGITTQARGHVLVSSKPGRGTTFEIFLPRVEEAPAFVPRDGSGITPVTESGTILLVEDDLSLRKLARTVLQQRGYMVLEASSGAEALLVGEAHTGTIDLVLTDIVMQGMSGWKVASALKATHPEARVLYMSGYAPDHDEMKHEAGDDASFLAKPFTPHSLRRRVRQILNGLKKAV